MNPEWLVDGVLGSVLGGRRKRGRRALRYLTRGGVGTLLANPAAVLTAAGVAWGIVETLKSQSGGVTAGGQSGWGGAAAQGTAPAGVAGPLPPLPTAGGQAAAVADEPALRLVRLAVSAALADGVLSDQERTTVLDQARRAGVAAQFEQELQQRRPLAEIVSGVTNAAERATLYVLAFTILRGDEQVTGADRIYLAQLAHLLGLDPQTVQRLEADTARRIDAQSEPGASPDGST